ncbi:hypothetical protein NDU88_007121 [Pleurodeles waltl]|uniref:Endonuclease/exonuclease/phosphatase domain-containing protein n=1 Tax=Pleurodeles waltl TaxID=8319 RepID=A0AAV7QKU5_PLEWA|nr:hypothetical protein NDU88_007121 [Pleurodeles waltl]
MFNVQFSFAKCHARSKPLRLLTWNVRSLNDNRKIHKVVAYQRPHAVDVAVLPETDLALGDKDTKQCRMQGLVCAAGFTSHVRRVLIWVRKVGGIGLREVCSDPTGRYVVAKCIIGNRALLVVGVYGPNYNNPSFYYNLSARLQQWADLPQLWGGDLNSVLNPDRDLSLGSPRRPSRAARALAEILSRDGGWAVLGGRDGAHGEDNNNDVRRTIHLKRWRGQSPVMEGGWSSLEAGKLPMYTIN